MELICIFTFFKNWWFLFALIFSLFFAFRSIYFSIIKGKTKLKDIITWNNFFHSGLTFIFNFLGSFFGWICFYILAIKYLNLTNADKEILFDFPDLFLFIFALLGMSGYLPQATFGLVKEFDNLAVLLSKKIGS